MLGRCPNGEILRIKRHNIIRSMIAQVLRSKGVELFSEVPSANKWVIKKAGPSCSEWRDILKMTVMNRQSGLSPDVPQAQATVDIAVIMKHCRMH